MGAFYKVGDDGWLLDGQNIFGPDFELTAETHLTNPAANGWQWFDSLDEAVAALGYTPPTV